jgi:hypothetical protein
MTQDNIWPLDFTAEQLEQVPSDLLHRMIRLWGGTGVESKAESIRRLQRGLADERAVRAALGDLTPEERAALALLKEYGGLMQAGIMEDLLSLYGYALERPRQPAWGFGYHRVASFVTTLLQRGLVLLVPQYQGMHAHYGHLRNGGSLALADYVYTDTRLLAQIDWPLELPPLAVTPLACAPAEMTVRRPQHVLLDLLAVARALTELRQVTLTKSGTVRVAELRRLAKSLGWAESPRFDGHPFRLIAEAMVKAWMRIGWLRCTDDVCLPTLSPERLAHEPLVKSVAHLAYGFVGAQGWSELDLPSFIRQEELNHPRSLLLHSLRALPDPGACYAVPAFMAALHPRVGDLLVTRQDYERPPAMQRGMSTGEHEALLALWNRGRAERWVARESAFAAAAFASWFYWLGLLELGHADGALIFRLTDLGRGVVTGKVEALPADAAVVTSEMPAWVVQPNFDVVVYLDRLAPAHLAFIEGHAERCQAEAHTAHYALTRESIYRGLESGTTVEEVLATLRAGMAAELPQNVAREICEWAGHRESLTVYTSARLIEFPTGDMREQALAAGLPGTRVGEGFVLVPPEAQVQAALKAVYGLRLIPSVDYTAAPIPCLEAREDGTLLLVEDTGDLLLRDQLARCAEPVTPTTWRITAAALAAVRGAGVSAATLLAFLQSRVRGILPPLLEIAIRNALGPTRQAVQGETAFVVRIADKKLYTALITSPTVQRLLLDVPGPDILLIAADKREEFQALLQWLGLKVAPLEGASARPDWLQIVRSAKSYERQRGRY